jgi:hypothetical protein
VHLPRTLVHLAAVLDEFDDLVGDLVIRSSCVATMTSRPEAGDVPDDAQHTLGLDRIEMRGRLVRHDDVVTAVVTGPPFHLLEANRTVSDRSFRATQRGGG